MRLRRDVLVVAALAVVVAACSIGKPLHIDDPFYLAVARHILADPLHPYSFDFFWGESGPRPVFEHFNHPPAGVAALAVVARVAGGSEAAMHLLWSVFTLLALAGMYLLASRFCARPLWPTAFLALSPAFLPSGNLMMDHAALAWWLLALAAWCRGVDEDRTSALVAGGVLAGLAILTKYGGLLLLPLMAGYALLQRRRRVGAGLAPARRQAVTGGLAIPFLMFAGWCAFTLRVYGHAHPFFRLHDAAGQALRPVADYLGELWAGCVALAACGWWMIPLLVLAVRRRSPRSPDTAWLLGWAGAAMVGILVLYPFMAVRHMLIVIPPLLILIEKNLEGRATTMKVFALAASAVVAILVQTADRAYAEAHRDYAGRIAAETRSRGVRAAWFTGHWGWQYYAERAGLRPLTHPGPAPERGDWVIVPRLVLTQLRHPGLAGRLDRFRQDVVPASIPVRTVYGLDDGVAVGYYLLPAGAVPWRISRDPVAAFDLYVVR